MAPSLEVFVIASYALELSSFSMSKGSYLHCSAALPLRHRGSHPLTWISFLLILFIIPYQSHINSKSHPNCKKSSMKGGNSEAQKNKTEQTFPFSAHCDWRESDEIWAAVKTHDWYESFRQTITYVWSKSFYCQLLDQIHWLEAVDRKLEQSVRRQEKVVNVGAEWKPFNQSKS